MRNGIIMVILFISCAIAQRYKPTPHCPILAIKIGYTNIHSCISIDGKVTNIIDEYGNQKIPNQYKFHEEYRQDTEQHRQNIKVGQILPLIGKKFSEVEKIDGLEFIEMDDKLYIKRGLYMFTPSDILSQQLMEMMQMSQGQYQTYQSILVVPAHFNSDMKEAIQNLIQFIQIVDIIEAPIATIKAHNLTKDGLILVVHYGSTAEFSLVKLFNGSTKIIGTDYDIAIDIDQVIIEHLNTVLTITDQSKLIHLIAGFKHEFINQSNSKIVIEEQEYTMNKDDFKQLIEPKLNQVMEIIFNLLKETNISKDQIDNIILTGGAIPLLKEKLYEYFEDKQFIEELHAEDAECFGGAIFGEQICNKHEIHNSGNMLTDLSYGIEMAGGIMKILVEKNSLIPLMPVTHIVELFLKNQKTAHLYFYQGERVLTKYNNQIAELHFQDLDSQQMTIQVNSDTHFNLNIIVKCGEQQKEISIPLEHSKNAQQIIQEAIEYQEEDEQERNLIEKISLKTREKQVSKQDGQIWFETFDNPHTDL